MKATATAAANRPTFYTHDVELVIPGNWTINNTVRVRYDDDCECQLRVDPELETLLRQAVEDLRQNPMYRLDLACTELPDSGLTITGITWGDW